MRALPLEHLAAFTLASLAIGIVAASCSKSDGNAGTQPPPPPPSAPPEGPSVPPSARAPEDMAGPIATIPAGKLVAGTACGDHPRVPAEELAGETIEMGAFDIDAYPYPNHPQKAPLTGVSRDEAKKLCEARGRRLCTELEWEHACKGPKNTRYEYGDRFDPKACPTGLGAIPPYDKFDRCASEYGVYAMHGFVWEWTASSFQRGKEEGKVALRGGYGNAPYAHMRCSGAKAGSPADKEASIGFRCCGGTANTREIAIPADETTEVLAEEKSVDDALLGRLRRAIVNGQLKDPEGTTSTFAKVWRWRAAPNDELVLARYESKPASGPTLVQPLVIRLCDKTVQLIGRVRSPAEAMEDPVVKPDAQGVATIRVKSGSNEGEVKLTYQYAQIATAEPAWLKAGSAPSASPSAAPSATPAAK